MPPPANDDAIAPTSSVDRSELSGELLTRCQAVKTGPGGYAAAEGLDPRKTFYAYRRWPPRRCRLAVEVGIEASLAARVKETPDE